jgi:hypothetical protein
MGIIAWLILLAVSVTFATVGHYTLSIVQHQATGYDWVYIAVGALLGGFMGSMWYPGIGPEVDGLTLLPALACAFAVGAVEWMYHAFARPRQSSIEASDLGRDPAPAAATSHRTRLRYDAAVDGPFRHTGGDDGFDGYDRSAHQRSDNRR